MFEIKFSLQYFTLDEDWGEIVDNIWGNQPTIMQVLSKNRKLIIGSLLLCCALFLLFSAASASAAGPTYVSTDITSDTTWSETGSPYVVTNNITVAEGATLTISSNVTVMVNYDTTMTIEGGLIVNGQAGKMVNMTANDTANPWNGIIATETSDLYLNYLYFNNATLYGLTASSDLFVNNSRFVDLPNYAIYWTVSNKSASLTVKNSYFWNDASGAYPAIYGSLYFSSGESWTASYDDPVVITGNWFNGGEGYDNAAIWYNAGAFNESSMTIDSPVTFEGNTFTNTYYANYNGLYIDRTISVADNASVSITGDISIKNNDFADLYRGYFVHDDFSAITDFNAEILVASDVTVSGNTFDTTVYYDGDLELSEVAYGKGLVNSTQNVNINNNDLKALNGALGIARHASAFDNATVIVGGDMIVEDNNFFVTNNNCLYLDEGMILSQMEEYSTVGSMSGKLDFTGNTITGSGDDAVYVGSWLYTYGLSSADFSLGVKVDGNTVDEVDDALVWFDAEFIANGNSTQTVSNALTVTNNEISHGVGFVRLDVVVEAMDDAKMTYAGPITVKTNTASELYGYGIYGRKIVVIGDDRATVDANLDITVLSNDLLCNGVTPISYAVYLNRGMFAYNDSVVNINGLVNIQNNKFQDQGSDSIWVRDNVTATTRAIGAQLTLVGDVKINDNQIKTSNGDGIVYNIEFRAASGASGADVLIDLSKVSWFIQGNELNMVSTSSGASYGIYWGCISEHVAVSGGNLTLKTGDVIISGNSLDMAGDHFFGVVEQVDLRVLAESGSTAIISAGDFVMLDNTISAVGDDNDGADLFINHFSAAGNEANATVIGGQMLVSGNAISMNGAGNNAILINPNPSGVYAVANGNHDYSVTVSVNLDGGINVAENIISLDGVNSYGIYLGVFELYTDSEYYLANATAKMDINIVDNAIAIATNSGDSIGIEIAGYSVDAQYGTSYSLSESNLLVQNNGITAAGQTGLGILVLDIDAHTIDYSDFRGMAWIVTSAIIEKNTVKGGAYGMYITGCGYDVQLVQNNITQSYEDGIYITHSLGNLVDNYVCNGYYDGIHVYQSDGVTLTDNTINDNGDDGLYIVDSDNVVVYNGYYNDNSYDAIDVEQCTITWIVDAKSTALCHALDSDMDQSGIDFAGVLYIMDGGVLTLDDCYFWIVPEYNAQIIVKAGGVFNAQNVDFDNYDAYDSDHSSFFEVYGTLNMMGGSMSYWFELYLAPNSTADINAASFMFAERYGIHVDDCSPVIASCTFFYNEMAGVYVEGLNASPSIETSVFFLNARGIYAEDANLGEVVNNIFAVNYVAGIYAKGVHGTISANTFLLNKAEIFLVDSTVTISDNELGYSHLIDVAGQYSPVASIIMNYLAGMTNLDIDLTDMVTSATIPTAPSSSTIASYVASLLLNHDGIMAYGSTVTCYNNVYGLVSWAVYAEDSVIIFGDSVKQNVLNITWLNSDLVSTYTLIPMTAVNGIYAYNSDVSINGATIQVLDTAVFLSSSSADIKNSKLLADQFDVYAVGNSSVTASGTVFDGKVKAVGDATVTSEFQLDILTTDAKGNIVTGVTVTVKNNQGVIVATGKSDDTGHFKCSVVAYKIVNGNVDDSMNPYTVTVSFNNGDVTSSVTMTDATALTIAAKVDNTALYVGIVAIAAVLLIIAAAVLLRRKN